MKKTIFSLALLSVIATSCSDSSDIINNITFPFSPTDPSDKEMISFSVSTEGGSASMSTMTRAGFDQATTQIAARFVSFDGTNYRHTRTKLNAAVDGSANHGANWESYSTVSYPDNDSKRFWDDAFGRDAKISIYAVAVPNKTDVQNGATPTALVDLLDHTGTAVNATTNPNWKTGQAEANSIDWKVTETTQTTDLIATEDLCYSNNIQNDNSAVDGLTYTRGKNGVRIWDGLTDADHENGYPKYKYVVPTPPSTDYYPTLADGMLIFRLTDPGAGAGSPGHFDKGHMIFHHALTRITVNLQKDVTEDGGFSTPQNSNTDFAFDVNDQIHLLGMPYKGTLNIKTGSWSNPTTKDDLKMATTTAATNMNYTNIAQVIPGYVLNKDNVTNVLKFKVSDNTYYITQAMLFDALKDISLTDHNGNPQVTIKDANKITLEQGKNYVFTINVKKTKIQSVTATLVPWINVTGSTADAGNNYVKINLHDKMSEACNYFDLYRMNDDATEIYAPESSGLNGGTDWVQNFKYYGDQGTASTQNYVDKAEFTASSPVDGKWTTKWFWPSNKSFYHFRTVNKDLAIQGNTTTAQDYINMVSGPVYDYVDPVSPNPGRTVMATQVNEYNKVNDFHWGAPFKNGASLTYDQTYGWSAATASAGQIYPAIGATTMDINMIEHHMMAKVNFVLHTARTSTMTGSEELPEGQWVHLKSTNGDASGTATRVTMNNFYGTGTVNMGSGLVTPTNPLINTELPIPGQGFATDPYSGDHRTLNSATVSTGYFAKGDTLTNAYSYRVIPQKLYRGDATPAAMANLDNYIGLKFVTADDNQYYVVQKLSEVLATKITKTTTSKTEQALNQPILFWYPGYEYTYHIYINKTGIAAITCTVVDWITVTGSPFDVTLED